MPSPWNYFYTSFFQKVDLSHSINNTIGIDAEGIREFPMKKTSSHNCYFFSGFLLVKGVSIMAAFSSLWMGTNMPFMILKKQVLEKWHKAPRQSTFSLGLGKSFRSRISSPQKFTELHYLATLALGLAVTCFTLYKITFLINCHF